MFSNEEHLDMIYESSGWDQFPCFESALLSDRPIEDCFGNNGIPVCYWPRDFGYDCCNHWLIIDLDFLEITRREFFCRFQEAIRNCDNLRMITICGSADKMSDFGITGNKGRNSSKFASYIVGINSMRNAGPVVVETKTVLGRGPNKGIIHHNYV